MLTKIIRNILDLISSYPLISSAVFLLVGGWILVFKIPKIKPGFERKDAGYYRELFIYIGLTIYLLIHGTFLLIKNI